MHIPQVTFSPTPNPQSLKFEVGVLLVDSAVNFTSRAESARSPLASKIFGFPWCAGVFLGRDFVTVTKQEWVDWEILAEPLGDLIAEHLTLGEPILYQAPPESGVTGRGPAAGASDDRAEDSPIVRQIKRVLREEIRPAVAQDGGDVAFEKYDAGKLFLSLHGACSGCPSSTITLKEGIEVRFKELIPEITEVLSL